MLESEEEDINIDAIYEEDNTRYLKLGKSSFENDKKKTHTHYCVSYGREVFDALRANFKVQKYELFASLDMKKNWACFNQ